MSDSEFARKLADAETTKAQLKLFQRKMHKHQLPPVPEIMHKNRFSALAEEESKHQTVHRRLSDGTQSSGSKHCTNPTLRDVAVFKGVGSGEALARRINKQRARQGGRPSCKMQGKSGKSKSGRVSSVPDNDIPESQLKPAQVPSVAGNNSGTSINISSISKSIEPISKSTCVTECEQLHRKQTCDKSVAENGLQEKSIVCGQDANHVSVSSSVQSHFIGDDCDIVKIFDEAERDLDLIWNDLSLCPFEVTKSVSFSHACENQSSSSSREAQAKASKPLKSIVESSSRDAQNGASCSTTFGNVSVPSSRDALDGECASSGSKFASDCQDFNYEIPPPLKNLDKLNKYKAKTAHSWRCVEAKVDSGAGVSVANRDTFGEYLTYPTYESERGITYTI